MSADSKTETELLAAHIGQEELEGRILLHQERWRGRPGTLSEASRELLDEMGLELGERRLTVDPTRHRVVSLKTPDEVLEAWTGELDTLESGLRLIDAESLTELVVLVMPEGGGLLSLSYLTFDAAPPPPRVEDAWPVAPIEALCEVMERDLWLTHQLKEQALLGQFGTLVALGTALRLHLIDHQERHRLEPAIRVISQWARSLSEAQSRLGAELLSAHVRGLSAIWGELSQRRHEPRETLPELLEVELLDMAHERDRIESARRALFEAGVPLATHHEALSRLDGSIAVLLDELPIYPGHEQDEWLHRVAFRQPGEWWGELAIRTELEAAGLDDIDWEAPLDDTTETISREDDEKIRSLDAYRRLKQVRSTNDELLRGVVEAWQQSELLAEHRPIAMAASSAARAVPGAKRWWRGASGWEVGIVFEDALERLDDATTINLEIEDLPEDAIALIVSTRWVELERGGGDQHHALTLGELRQGFGLSIVLVRESSVELGVEEGAR